MPRYVISRALIAFSLDQQANALPRLRQGENGDADVITLGHFTVIRVGAASE